MVLVLHLVSYIAGLAGFCFALLSLGAQPPISPVTLHPRLTLRPAANGLLYVAEVIEEHSAFAKTVGQRIIYVRPSLPLPVPPALALD